MTCLRMQLVNYWAHPTHSTLRFEPEPELSKLAQYLYDRCVSHALVYFEHVSRNKLRLRRRTSHTRDRPSSTQHAIEII